MIYYLDETKLYRDNYVAQRCHCKKNCICICDDMILNKKCVCRLFLTQEEMDDEIEMAKIKNEEIRKAVIETWENHKKIKKEIKNVFYIGETRYRKLDDVEHTIKNLLKRKANFLYDFDLE